MRFPRFVESLFRRNAAPAAANLEARDPALITLISVVYSTQPKTFTGDAVYVTMTAPKSTPTSAKSDDDDEESSTTTVRSTAKATSSSSLSITSSRSSTTSTPTSASSSLSTTIPVAATLPPTATAVASTGMSGGAKAGLAFGLIILFALLGGAIFFFIKKRKENHESHQKLDDEKDFLALGRKPSAPTQTTQAGTAPFGAAAIGGVFAPKLSEKPTPPPPTAGSDRQRFSYEEEAPRLSLRAVSQFEPSILGHNHNRASGANPSSLSSNAPTLVAPAAGVVAAKVAGAGSNGSLASDPNNPFGNHAEKLSASPPQSIPLPPSPRSSTGRISPGPQAADFPLPESQPITPKAPSPTVSKVDIAGGAAVGAAAIAAATAAAASNKPLVSPASTPAGQPGESVHRVQLDFNPSMDDELEIHAGQLVRVLHEYDDGWAFCIRMDRSRQGVVPRTCLSKHPVKPRPQSPGRPGPRGPPPGIRPGGPPPFAQSPRPLSPANGRSSPASASFAQASRPLTPTNGRNRSSSSSGAFTSHNPNSASPGGSQLRQQENANSKARSNSMSNVNSSSKKDATPSKIPTPVGKVLSRKPVPAQP